MEIRKADSKGRVTGFEPGEYYAFDREEGQFLKMDIDEAMAQIMFKARMIN